MADPAHDLIARSARHFGSDRVCIDDLVRFRIDDQDACFHSLEESMSAFPAIPQRLIGEARARLALRLVVESA